MFYPSFRLFPRICPAFDFLTPPIDNVLLMVTAAISVDANFHDPQLDILTQSLASSWLINKGRQRAGAWDVEHLPYPRERRPGMGHIKNLTLPTMAVFVEVVHLLFRSSGIGIGRVRGCLISPELAPKLFP